MNDPLKPTHSYSYLLVGWSADAGKLGESITDYLIKNLNGQFFYEIDPEEYFPLGGVAIEDDLVQFPESRFYICPDHNLAIFKSTPPSFEAYKFIERVLDIAENNFKVREIYTISSLISLSSHNVSRQLIGVFNTSEIKNDFVSYDIDIDSNYETPPGQKPSLNSLLLWTARRRQLRAIDILVTVPFYLMSLDDPQSQRTLMEFLNQRFNWDINLSVLEQAAYWQNNRINDARKIYPEIDSCLTRLENNLRLSEDENMKLVKLIEEFLKERAV